MPKIVQNAKAGTSVRGNCLYMSFVLLFCCALTAGMESNGEKIARRRRVLLRTVRHHKTERAGLCEWPWDLTQPDRCSCAAIKRRSMRTREMRVQPQPEGLVVSATRRYDLGCERRTRKEQAEDGRRGKERERSSQTVVNHLAVCYRRLEDLPAHARTTQLGLQRQYEDEPDPVSALHARPPSSYPPAWPWQPAQRFRSRPRGHTRPS